MTLTFDKGTLPEVAAILEKLHASRQLCRVFLGDTKTGKSWKDDCDVAGRIGRSTGTQKIPLIVEPRADGGPALLSAHIVGIVVRRGDNRNPDHHFIYRHPTLDLGVWRIAKEDDWWVTYCDGEVFSRHIKQPNAARFVAFMTGKRLLR